MGNDTLVGLEYGTLVVLFGVNIWAGSIPALMLLVTALALVYGGEGSGDGAE